MAGINYTVKSFFYVLLGLITLITSLLFFFIFSIPTLIYRWTLYTFLAPYFRPDLISMVTPESHGFATEFLGSKRRLRPRCSIVPTFILKGTLEKKEWIRILKERWINAIDKSTGKLKFPELQQYLEEWMGYIFWVQDRDFDLENHVHSHSIDDILSPEDSKKFVDNLVEELLTAPYVSRRSPWDLHVVPRYKDPERQRITTAAIFRFHHSLGDGFALMSLIAEELAQTPLSTCKIAKPTELPNKTRNQLLPKVLKVPIQLVHDLGYSVSLYFSKLTPFHVLDHMKQGKMFYVRSPMIPISKIKEIKNKLSCSFTGVVLTCLASSVGKGLRLTNGSLKSLPFVVAVPLPRHGNNLANYVTGTIIELPIDHQLVPMKRLERIEDNLQSAKESTLPILFSLFQKFVYLHPSHLASFLGSNQALSMGLSNFPGPNGVQLKVDGKYEILSGHFTCGPLMGVAGVGWQLVTFNQYLHIALNVECGVMGKGEVEKLMKQVCEEIEELYKECLRH